MFKTELKILNTCAFIILNYGCERWSCNAERFSKSKVHVFALCMWCHRRNSFLKLKWWDSMSSEKVSNCLQTKLHFMEVIMKAYWRGNWIMQNIYWEARGDYISNIIILGPLEGQREVGSLRRTWMKDIIEYINGRVKKELDNKKMETHSQSSW